MPSKNGPLWLELQQSYVSCLLHRRAVTTPDPLITTAYNAKQRPLKYLTPALAVANSFAKSLVATTRANGLKRPQVWRRALNKLFRPLNRLFWARLRCSTSPAEGEKESLNKRNAGRSLRRNTHRSGPAYIGPPPKIRAMGRRGSPEHPLEAFMAAAEPGHHTIGCVIVFLQRSNVFIDFVNVCIDFRKGREDFSK